MVIKKEELVSWDALLVALIKLSPEYPGGVDHVMNVLNYHFVEVKKTGQRSDEATISALFQMTLFVLSRGAEIYQKFPGLKQLFETLAALISSMYPHLETMEASHPLVDLGRPGNLGEQFKNWAKIISLYSECQAPGDQALPVLITSFRRYLLLCNPPESIDELFKCVNQPFPNPLTEGVLELTTRFDDAELDFDELLPLLKLGDAAIDTTQPIWPEWRILKIKIARRLTAQAPEFFQGVLAELKEFLEKSRAQSEGQGRQILAVLAELYHNEPMFFQKQSVSKTKKKEKPELRLVLPLFEGSLDENALKFVVELLTAHPSCELQHLDQQKRVQILRSLSDPIPEGLLQHIEKNLELWQGAAAGPEQVEERQILTRIRIQSLRENPRAVKEFINQHFQDNPGDQRSFNEKFERLQDLFFKTKWKNLEFGKAWVLSCLDQISPKNASDEPLKPLRKLVATCPHEIHQAINWVDWAVKAIEIFPNIGLFEFLEAIFPGKPGEIFSIYVEKLMFEKAYLSQRDAFIKWWEINGEEAGRMATVDTWTTIQARIPDSFLINWLTTVSETASVAFEFPFSLAIVLDESNPCLSHISLRNRVKEGLLNPAGIRKLLKSPEEKIAALQKLADTYYVEDKQRFCEEVIGRMIDLREGLPDVWWAKIFQWCVDQNLEIASVVAQIKRAKSRIPKLNFDNKGRWSSKFLKFAISGLGVKKSKAEERELVNTVLQFLPVLEERDVQRWLLSLNSLDSSAAMILLQFFREKFEAEGGGVDESDASEHILGVLKPYLGDIHVSDLGPVWEKIMPLFQEFQKQAIFFRHLIHAVKKILAKKWYETALSDLRPHLKPVCTASPTTPISHLFLAWVEAKIEPVVLREVSKTPEWVLLVAEIHLQYAKIEPQAGDEKLAAFYTKALSQPKFLSNASVNLRAVMAGVLWQILGRETDSDTRWSDSPRQHFAAWQPLMAPILEGVHLRRLMAENAPAVLINVALKAPEDETQASQPLDWVASSYRTQIIAAYLFRVGTLENPPTLAEAVTRMSAWLNEINEIRMNHIPPMYHPLLFHLLLAWAKEVADKNAGACHDPLTWKDMITFLRQVLALIEEIRSQTFVLPEYPQKRQPEQDLPQDEVHAIAPETWVDLQHLGEDPVTVLLLNHLKNPSGCLAPFSADVKLWERRALNEFFYLITFKRWLPAKSWPKYVATTPQVGGEELGEFVRRFVQSHNQSILASAIYAMRFWGNLGTDFLTKDEFWGLAEFVNQHQTQLFAAETRFIDETATQIQKLNSPYEDCFAILLDLSLLNCLFPKSFQIGDRSVSIAAFSRLWMGVAPLFTAARYRDLPMVQLLIQDPDPACWKPETKIQIAERITTAHFKDKTDSQVNRHTEIMVTALALGEGRKLPADHPLRVKTEALLTPLLHLIARHGFGSLQILKAIACEDPALPEIETALASLTQLEALRAPDLEHRFLDPDAPSLYLNLLNMASAVFQFDQLGLGASKKSAKKSANPWLDKLTRFGNVGLIKYTDAAITLDVAISTFENTVIGIEDPNSPLRNKQALSDLDRISDGLQKRLFNRLNIMNQSGSSVDMDIFAKLLFVKELIFAASEATSEGFRVGVQDPKVVEQELNHYFAKMGTIYSQYENYKEPVFNSLMSKLRAHRDFQKSRAPGLFKILSDIIYTTENKRLIAFLKQEWSKRCLDHL